MYLIYKNKFCTVLFCVSNFFKVKYWIVYTETIEREGELQYIAICLLAGSNVLRCWPLISLEASSIFT